MKILITGGCGFLGTNLALYAVKNGCFPVIFDSLKRTGSDRNLSLFEGHGKIKFIRGDIRDNEEIARVVKEYKPEAVFHLAGQVSMQESLENPRWDFEVNALGTINLLEAVRKFSPECITIYSSTNKIYGDLSQYSYTETQTRYVCEEFPHGFDESVPLTFHSPYGCSKGSADQYMLDYARVFGLKTVVFRHSSMYGERQFATFDQGWVGWFCLKGIEAKKNPSVKPFTISGTGKQVRDLLHCDDVGNLYFSTIENIQRAKGCAFNIGGGPANSLSLLELFSLIEDKLDVKLSYVKTHERKSDQKVFIADIKKAKELIKWRPSVSPEKGIDRMLDWTRVV